MLPAGDCLQVTRVTVSHSCPMTFGTTRSVRFDVTAQTTLRQLRWRRASRSSDVLTPNEGALVRNGDTSVTFSDIVLDSAVTIEILSGESLLLSFTLRSY
jgi:hypothetical protein